MHRGDKLPSERDLQQQLGIRRLSLKEAFALHAATGIIKIVPGKGACVASEIKRVSLNDVLVPSVSDWKDSFLRDLCEVRSQIEGQVAVLAAGRRSDEDLAEPWELLSHTESALDDPNVLGEMGVVFTCS